MILILDKEDILNRNRERNEGNTKREKYNCGGYALGTYNWYYPGMVNKESVDRSFEDDIEFVAGLLADGYNREEAQEEYLNVCTEMILADFGEDIRVVGFDEPCAEGEELIAFRVAIEAEEDERGLSLADIDYHFRVLRDSEWYEKCGRQEIHGCVDDVLGEWRGGLVYDSSTVFFAKKVA